MSRLARLALAGTLLRFINLQAKDCVKANSNRIYVSEKLTALSRIKLE